MYKFNDVVEVGYLANGNVGGSVYISIEVTKYDIEIFKDLKTIIDKLDHTILTDKDEIISFSKRFYLLDSLENIYVDISSIIKYFLKDKEYKEYLKMVDIKIGNISYNINFDDIKDKKIIKYRAEG